MVDAQNLVWLSRLNVAISHRVKFHNSEMKRVLFFIFQGSHFWRRVFSIDQGKWNLTALTSGGERFVEHPLQCTQGTNVSSPRGMSISSLSSSPLYYVYSTLGIIGCIKRREVGLIITQVLEPCTQGCEWGPCFVPHTVKLHCQQFRQNLSCSYLQTSIHICLTVLNGIRIVHILFSLLTAEYWCHGIAL